MQSARYEIPSDYTLTYDAFQALLRMVVEEHGFIPDSALMAKERYETLRAEVLTFSNVHHSGTPDHGSAPYEQLFLLNRAVPGFDIRIIRSHIDLTKIAFVAHW
jgi:hypothetical protein